MQQHCIERWSDWRDFLLIGHQPTSSIEQCRCVAPTSPMPHNRKNRHNKDLNSQAWRSRFRCNAESPEIQANHGASGKGTLNAICNELVQRHGECSQSTDAQYSVCMITQIPVSQGLILGQIRIPSGGFRFAALSSTWNGPRGYGCSAMLQGQPVLGLARTPW